MPNRGVAVAAVGARPRRCRSPRRSPGWAEQDPAVWWTHGVAATRAAVAASGLSGGRPSRRSASPTRCTASSLTDGRQRVLRPAIIWCDSRAVAHRREGVRARSGAEDVPGPPAQLAGELHRLQARWVKENEPELFAPHRTRCMLPGRLHRPPDDRGARTTASGLSEGILWDFLEGRRRRHRAGPLRHAGEPCVPERRPDVRRAGSADAAAAGELGLAEPACRVTYRAGDQPNNAFSLNVLEPGEIAATAGTSGVVYGVSDQAALRPAVAREHLRARQPRGRSPALRRAPVRERHGHPLQLAEANARWRGSAVLRRDEPRGARGARRLGRRASSCPTATAPSARWRTGTPAPRVRASTSTATRRAHLLRAAPGRHRLRAALRPGHHAGHGHGRQSRCGPGTPTCS